VRQAFDIVDGRPRTFADTGRASSGLTDVAACAGDSTLSEWTGQGDGIKIQEQTPAEDHPDRRGSQYNLAEAYRANGRVEEAVALLEKVVKIREQTQTEDHPDRLISQCLLTIIY
jgi:hypothetical protein